MIHTKLSKVLTKQLLLKEYTKNLKSANQIAKKLRCSSGTIYIYLKKYNIKTRTYIEALSGKKAGRFKDGRTMKKYYCKDCGIKITYQSGYYGQGKCNHCNQISKPLPSKEAIRNQSLAHGGTGIPYENDEYGAEFDNALKEQVRFRDKYKCQVCGCPQIENGRQLDVHHIDYNKRNNILNNLVSLCRKCHMKTNYNREEWEEYFQAKLRRIHETQR